MVRVRRCRVLTDGVIPPIFRKERRRFPRRAVTHHQQTELSRRPRLR